MHLAEVRRSKGPCLLFLTQSWHSTPYRSHLPLKTPKCNFALNFQGKLNLFFLPSLMQYWITQVKHQDANLFSKI